MNNIKRRLNRLQQPNEAYSDILLLIRQKRRYSELTDDQKERYCRYYYGIERDVVEEVQAYVCMPDYLETDEEQQHWLKDYKANLDFVLEKRPPKMSPEEEKKHIAKVAKEIEAIVFEYRENPQQRLSAEERKNY